MKVKQYGHIYIGQIGRNFKAERHIYEAVTLFL